MRCIVASFWYSPVTLAMIVAFTFLSNLSNNLGEGSVFLDIVKTVQLNT